MITSSQNHKVKLARSLMGRAKNRRKEKAFVIEGVRLFEEAVAAQRKIRFVLYDRTLSERGRTLVESLQGVDIEEVDSALLNTISDTETSQGLLAVLDFFQLPLSNKPDFFLIPDQVRDPGNLGTLLRTAAAAGVDAVLLPPGTTDAFAPKVLRAGMGAHFHLPLCTMTWEEIEAQLRGSTVYMAEAQGDVLYTEASLGHACALIVGGEAEGASKEGVALTEATLRIPISEKVESLNAAIAGAILLFEVARQRGFQSLARDL